MKVRISKGVYMSISEVFYEVVVQKSKKQNDDKDQLICLCFRAKDARRIKNALQQAGGKEK